MRRLTLHLGILEGILFCFLFLTSGVESSSGDHDGEKAAADLYFGVFISQESTFDFSGFLPPLELGVDTINNNSTTLKGLNERDYVIKYVISNGKVSPSCNTNCMPAYTEPLAYSYTTRSYPCTNDQCMCMRLYKYNREGSTAVDYSSPLSIAIIANTEFANYFQ